MRHLRLRTTVIGLCTFIGVLAGAAAGGVCGPGNGDCFSANGTPGCEDTFCCSTVCASDPFCCDTEWDEICADAAAGSPACDPSERVWGVGGASPSLVTFFPLDPDTSLVTVGPLTGLTGTQIPVGLAWTPEWTLWMAAFDTDDGSSELHQLDPATGATLLEMPITGLDAEEGVSDLAYNPFSKSMDMLTSYSSMLTGRIHVLDVSTGAAVPFFTIKGGALVGLAVTSDGNSYVEDIAGDQIVRLDANYNLVGFLDLQGDANFSQGLGANWSRDDLLGLAAINADLPSDENSLFLTFLPDLTGLLFRGVIGGAGTDEDLGDVAWRPDCTTGGCDDGDPCTVDTCVDGQCVSSVPVCGDGVVDPCEDCETCPFDVPCGPDEECVAGVCELLCGNGVVDPGEDCDTCPQDVPCGIGEVCNPATGDCELPPTGGCCQCVGAGQFCTIETADDCATFGGIYLGDDTDCDAPGAITVTSSPNTPLPDGDPAGVSDTITIVESITVNALSVGIEVDHTFLGDLCVTLSKDGGPAALIMSRINEDTGGNLCHLGSPFGCGFDNMNVTLDDNAAQSIEDQCATDLSGVYRPAPDLLASFTGMDSAGDWTITVSDNAGFDTGTLVSWTLTLSHGSGLTPCEKDAFDQCGDGCPWDCAGDDRVVDTVDFLALLADWGVSGGPCDFGQGSVGIDTPDFLALLANWGSCPGCAADNECDDGLYCNGVETCDPITGECIPGIPPCDDGLACTDNGCDEVNDVCVFTPVQCKSDNNECTDTFCVEPDGCITEPSPTGTVCGAPGMICDGDGNCVPE